MRYNGLQLVIRMAVARLGDPLLQRYADALVLGAIREDIVYLPRKQAIWEHWSLSHFSGRYLGGGFIPWLTASAPVRAQHLFDRALKAWHGGDQARAIVQLGRASHLLIDMACPVHASRVAHMTDGYEWFVEAHCVQLATLPFQVPQHYASVHDIVEGLARYTRQFPPDRTNHHWGRLLKKLGLRRSHTRAEFSTQSEQIIPAAAGHLAALYQHFTRMAKAT